MPTHPRDGARGGGVDCAGVRITRVIETRDELDAKGTDHRHGAPRAIEWLIPRPEDSLRFFVHVIGMTESGRDGASVFLRGQGGYETYSLKLIGPYASVTWRSERAARLRWPAAPRRWRRPTGASSGWKGTAATAPPTASMTRTVTYWKSPTRPLDNRRPVALLGCEPNRLPAPVGQQSAKAGRVAGCERASRTRVARGQTEMGARHVYECPGPRVAPGASPYRKLQPPAYDAMDNGYRRRWVGEEHDA